jgi:hypothetical protein
MYLIRIRLPSCLSGGRCERSTLHDLEGYEPDFERLEKFSLRNQGLMKMALRKHSVHCFRKFKGLQLTFQVVTLSSPLAQDQDHQLIVDEVWYHGMTP